MSVSPEEFIQLLKGMLSPDNASRVPAEAQYNSIAEANPVWTMSALAEVSATSQEPAVVTIGLILLRKIFNATPSPYVGADNATQENVKARMLSVLTTAAYGSQSGSAAACVSALAVQVNQMKQPWDDLWRNVFEILGAAESPNELKLVCFKVIGVTCTSMSEFFLAHGDAVCAGIDICFSSPHCSSDLKCSAFDVAVRLATCGMDEKVSPLVPKMLNVIQEYLNAKDWDAVDLLIMSAVDGVGSCPSLFKDHTVNLLSGMMQVACSEETEQKTRHIAVETMLTYCESEPKLIRKIPNFATSFFELLFQYMLNPEMPDNWDTCGRNEEGDEAEATADFDVGCSGLDRIANSLGGRKLQATAQTLLASNIGAADWRQRNAALMMICYVAEGMQAVFSKALPSLVGMIVQHVSDDSKYVRASALDCLSQLSSDYSPELQTTTHAAILPAAVRALHDPVPHVASCAANCLDAFIDSAEGDDEEEDDEDGLDEMRAILAPYVQPICEQCVSLVQNSPHVFVREAALGVLSSLTATCKTALVGYVAALVPVYQQVLSLPDDSDSMKCKCKAIECVTLLACGVGAQPFAPYSADVCNYLAQLTAGGMADDDIRKRYVMRGWTCMVECLKEDIAPYLDTLMPMLLTMMESDCDVVISSAGVGDDDDDDDTPEGVQKLRFVIPNVGERVATVHTSQIEDKELACNVVYSILSDVAIKLAPSFYRIVTCAVKLLSFVASESIRQSGMLILTEVLTCYRMTNAPEVEQVVALALPALIEALNDEDESFLLQDLMTCIGECVGACPQAVTQENAQLVCTKLMAVLNLMVTKRNKCLEAKEKEDDEDELDALEAEDDETQEAITAACDLVGKLLRISNNAFAGLFVQHIYPALTAWMQPSADDFYLQRALAMLCDLLEHCSAFMVAHLPAVCNTAIYGATQRHDADVLQACFFLLKLIAKMLTETPGAAAAVNPNDVLAQAQQALANFLGSNAVRDATYSHATCNALAAYVTMVDLYAASALQAKSTEMMTMLMHAIPLKDDEEEARNAHDVLLRWVSTNSPVLQLVNGSAAAIVSQLKTAEEDTLSKEAMQYLSTV